MLARTLDVVRAAALVLIAAALLGLWLDRPAGAGPGAYPRAMECVKVFEDRWRCDFR